VPKAPAPESRQPYAGITINQSKDVILLDNHVAVSDSTDFGYIVVGDASFDRIVSRDNYVCNGRLTGDDWAGSVETLSDGCELDLSGNFVEPVQTTTEAALPVTTTTMETTTIPTTTTTEWSEQIHDEIIDQN